MTARRRWQGLGIADARKAGCDRIVPVLRPCFQLSKHDIFVYGPKSVNCVCLSFRSLRPWSRLSYHDFFLCRLAKVTPPRYTTFERRLASQGYGVSARCIKCTYTDIRIRDGRRRYDVRASIEYAKLTPRRCTSYGWMSALQALLCSRVSGNACTAKASELWTETAVATHSVSSNIQRSHRESTQFVVEC